MNILLLSGPVAPKAGNNVTLLLKLLPHLPQQNKLRLLSAAGNPSADPLPSMYRGIPVFWPQTRPAGIWGVCRSAVSKIVDRNGFSDYIQAKHLVESRNAIPDDAQPDVILSTMEPFAAADAAARWSCGKRILYLMDPPAAVSDGANTAYRNRRLNKILAKQDTILTTPFIRDALISHGFGSCADKIMSVGFPLIETNSAKTSAPDSGRIHLLFCGWLYSDIRSPRYFLDILSRLDERFVVTFMGRECENLTERFDVQTNATLITLPQQPYEAALQAMADADIMINIGNSVPVHMPSKTLEYINTGKPFVNFYKMDNCPTLYYTKRYPLCLNMSEKDTELDDAAQRFIRFCVENKGKTVDRAYIEREYEDCTPQYIAQKILDALGETHG